MFAVNADAIIVGGGFLAENVMQSLGVRPTAGSEPELSYVGIELSATMHNKSSTRLSPYITNGNVKFNLVGDSVRFAQQIDFPVDRFVLTYVLDLMPPETINAFMKIFKGKARNKDSKVCIANLTYGVDGLSRIVTNIWQLLYVTLGGEHVGGCKPFDALTFFNKNNFNREFVKNVVSTGLPSQVLVFGINK